MSTTKIDTHIYYLDAVRTFALLLGIIYHGIMSKVSYIPEAAWAVKEQHSNIGMDVLFFVSHTFRMQAFYLVAGFFAHMVYQKYGLKGFIVHRFNRITKPMFVFWPFIVIILTTIWLWGYQKMGFFSSNPALSELRLPEIILLRFTSGTWLENGVPLMHLWFLYYLTLFFITVIIVRLLFDFVIDSNNNFRVILDKFVSYLMVKPWGSLIFAIFTIPAMWYMKNGFGVDTPDGGLSIQIPPFIVYGLYFFLGWFLHRNQHLLDGFRKYLKSNIVLSLLLVTITCALFMLQITNPLPIHANRTLFLKIYNSLYGFASVTSVFAFIGIMKVLFEKPSPIINYLSSASYWIYIIHIPVIVFFQVIVWPLSIHWSLKFCIILMPSVIILFLSYHYMVRHTWIGAMLNGKKL